MRIRRLSITEIGLILLIVVSIIPDIGIKFSTFGFTWTAYRLYVPLCLLASILFRGKIRGKRKTNAAKWIKFLFFWSVYGIVLLFVGRYSDRHNGFVEWLSIFNGLIVIYLLNHFIDKDHSKDLTIKAVFWLLNLMLLIGFVEIISGRHWIASAFYDQKSSIYEYSNTHQATGFMYNMNDFSAMITCLTPVLINKRLGKKRILSLIGVLLINLINDATTCTLAIVVFFLFYFLILLGGKTSRARLLRILFWIICIAGLMFFITSGAGLAKRNDFIGAFTRQIINAKGSSGSLYARLVMYKDALWAWFSTGMLGMGPAGYSNYFTINRSLSELVNPHALILEILTQYGIIITAWFVGLLICMYRKAKRQFDMNDNEQKDKGLIVIAFIIIYSIASFASSTFIGYSYQWMLIAVMCSFLDNKIEIGGITIA